MKQMDRQASFDPEVKLLLPRISVDLLEADEVVIEDVDQTDKHAAVDKHEAEEEKKDAGSDAELLSPLLVEQILDATCSVDRDTGK